MNEIANNHLGKLVTTLREERGYSIAFLAKIASINPQTIRWTEAGRSIPSRATIDRLSKALPGGADAFKGFVPKANKPTKPGTFGAFLRELREDRKLTSPELASSVDIEPSTISAYELNRNLPSMNHLELLMEELGFTPENPSQLAVNRGRPKRINSA